MLLFLRTNLNKATPGTGNHPNVRLNPTQVFSAKLRTAEEQLYWTVDNPAARDNEVAKKGAESLQGLQVDPFKVTVDWIKRRTLRLCQHYSFYSGRAAPWASFGSGKMFSQRGPTVLACYLSFWPISTPSSRFPKSGKRLDGHEHGDRWVSWDRDAGNDTDKARPGVKKWTGATGHYWSVLSAALYNNGDL
ncbi:hypothetical protein Bbelb_139520 [Branchiostoma belcheri]|nr:hypothetical protein Bbelb_139520 [Branchiostoma belcheri]